MSAVGGGRRPIFPGGGHRAIFTLYPQYEKIIKSWCYDKVTGARRSRSEALRIILEKVGVQK